MFYIFYSIFSFPKRKIEIILYFLEISLLSKAINTALNRQNLSIFTIISLQFHNERALYIAGHWDLDVDDVDVSILEVIKRNNRRVYVRCNNWRYGGLGL